MSSCCVKCGQSLPAISAGSKTREQGESLCEDCRDATLAAVPEDVESPIGQADKVVAQRSVESTALLRPGGAGDRIAHFNLVRLLGHGSFGDVWLADDSRLNRQVALKLPRSRDPNSPTLLYEAKTAARLQHPNIVAVYEVGEDRGQIFIASELIEGITLRDFLSAGRPSIERMIDLLIPICEALQYAHEHEIVHRDIKPDNILLDRNGKPYVTDFGLAKSLSADETISSRGQVVGTARYMSPEQAYGKSEDTDTRSDIYAVGVMMFEMMTGESPFRGTARAILQQKGGDDAPSPRTLEPAIPRDLDTICLKCLEREPNKRFDSAMRLVEELRRFTRGEPIESRPIGPVERSWRWCKRRPAVSSLLLALFLSLSTGLAGVSYFWRNSVLSADDARQKLYRSWMNLAANHVQGGNPAGVRELLDRVSADPQLSKLRNFEFDYFSSLVEQISPVGNAGGPIVDVAVTYDGNTSAATSGGREIQVWDTAGGRLLRVLRAEQDGFTTIDFSSSTSQLVAGSVDGTLRFYNPLGSDRLVNQVQHGPPIRHVAYSPNGRFVIAAGKKGAVRLWDASGENLLAQIPTGRMGETRAICFSPDSSRLYVIRDNGLLRCWKMDDLLAMGPEAIPTPEAGFNTAQAPVAMTATAEQLVIAFYDGSVMVIDPAVDFPASSGMVHKTNWGLIQDIEHVSQSSLVALTTSVGLYVLDLRSGREIRSLGTHGATGRLARSGNGKRLLTGSGDGSVSSLDLQQLVRPEILWGRSPVRSIQFMGPRKIAAAYEGGEFAVWDVATGGRIQLDSPPSRPVTIIAMDSVHDQIATAGNRPGIEIRRAATLQTIAELPAPDAGVSALQFSSSGRLLAVACRQGPVRLYAHGQWSHPKVEIDLDESLASSLAISPDERLLAVARTVHGVDLFDTSSGEVVTSIPPRFDESLVVTFCQEGKTLAIGTSAGSLHLYDLPSQRVRVTSKGHTGPINALNVMSRSGLIVSGGRDRRLYLWDVDSGELVTRLTGHFRQIFAVTSSPGEQMIVSGGLDADVRIWRANR